MDMIESETSRESAALQRVNEAASDYLLALDNEGFAAEFGGVEALLEELRAAQYAWEETFNTEITL